MFGFIRGIDQLFVDRLNEEYEAGGWWKAIADDRELFVAIRKDYINVYWKGNSLLKLWLEGNDLVGKIHYKYLLHPESTQPYVKVINGQARLGSETSLFMPDFTHLTGLKRTANAYSGEEKESVHQILIHNPNVIDVEIAFSAENEKLGRATASRIDFAALRFEQSGPEIVFFEAKLFANKELRANGEGVPVLNQLRRYQNFLRDGQADLVRSYRKVCGNLISLKGIENRYAPMLDMMKDIAENKCNFSIRENVRLVIFGFDIDQRDGANWAVHREKLKAVLGDNLLLKGDTKKFSNGISL